MDQLTLAQGSFESHRKATRREQFLLEMNQIFETQFVCGLIQRFPKQFFLSELPMSDLPLKRQFRSRSN